MMMTEKMIALMINLLLGQITESSTRMRERLKNCDSDKDISMQSSEDFTAAPMLKFDSETQTMQLIDLQETGKKLDPLTSDLPIEKFLDGCHHVYLDIGTNIGIQIRKLYEPKKYKGAPVHDIFNKYFHRNIKDLNSSLPYICAIGIEPNPTHEQELKNLNAAYEKCNWKVKILTQTAVSNHEGSGEFFSDNDLANLEVGGTIFERSEVYGKKKEKDNGNLIEYYFISPLAPLSILLQNMVNFHKSGIHIQLIRLANFINKVVGQRKLPENIDEKILGKPSVVVKLDIEGTEVEVIQDLIMQGSLQHIDVMMIEFHTWLAETEEKKKPFEDIKDIITKVGEVSEYLNKNRENKVHILKVLDFDDESYYKSDFSLPVCY